MEIATIAIAATGLIVATHVVEWAKLKAMSPEEREEYKKKNRLRTRALKRSASIKEAREKRLERERIQEEERLREEQRAARAQHRDAETQETPFEYRVGRHANEALAIRYGIANQVTETIEGFYYAKGGIKRRDSSRDRVRYVPATKIAIMKVEKVGESKYRALLPSYRNREVIVVIEEGKEYVKTFLPKDQNWFKQFAQLEETLKGNGSFNLKELARFHIEKAVK